VRSERFQSLFLASVSVLCVVFVTGLTSADEIVGDWNGDGLVNDDDLSLVVADWDYDAPSTGEFGWDPWPPPDDLSLVLANWTGPCETIDLVPEPTTLSLLAVAAVVVFRHPWERRR